MLNIWYPEKKILSKNNFTPYFINDTWDQSHVVEEPFTGSAELLYHGLSKKEKKKKKLSTAVKLLNVQCVVVHWSTLGKYCVIPVVTNSNPHTFTPFEGARVMKCDRATRRSITLIEIDKNTNCALLNCWHWTGWIRVRILTTGDRLEGTVGRPWREGADQEPSEIGQKTDVKESYFISFFPLLTRT